MRGRPKPGRVSLVAADQGRDLLRASARIPLYQVDLRRVEKP